MFSNRKTIEFVRGRTSILDVISKYISSVKKKGKDYVALCPFHNEKTPSFYVSVEKQIFHCFGCGKGGDVFRFVSEIENIEFPKALKKVADLSNIVLEKDAFNVKLDKAAIQKEELKKREIKVLWDLMDKASKIFGKNFDDISNPGYKYLLSRGLTPGQILEVKQIFHIGYARNSWNHLLTNLTGEGYSKEELLRIGLTNKNQSERMYDRFRDRLIFPILDENGRTAAFGARTLNDENQPKYLNSPDSLIFKKGKLLYGLYQSMAEIRRTKRIFIMEGYLDVIASYLAGLTNSAAPLGTSLTEDHLRLISRFAKEVYLVFDSDKAGENAVLRVSKISRNFPLDFFVMRLPAGEDPFDFFQKKDKVEFFSLVDKADNLAVYELKYFLNSIGGKEGLALAFESIDDTQSLIQKEKGIKQIASIIGVNEFTVKEEFASFSKGRKKGNTFITNSNLGSKFQSASNSGIIKNQSSQGGKKDLELHLSSHERNIRELMHKLLIIAIQFPETLENLIMDFSLDSFRTYEDRDLFMKLSESHMDGTIVNSSSLGDLDLDEEYRNKILGELFSINYDDKENTDIIYRRTALLAEKFILDKKIKNIKKRIKEAELKNNSRLFNSGLEDLTVLNRDKDTLVIRLHKA